MTLEQTVTEQTPERGDDGRFVSPAAVPDEHDGPPFFIERPPPGPAPGPLTDDPHYREADRASARKDS